MTIVEPTTLKEVYTMNGVAVLPFTFPVAQEEDLKAYSYDTVEGDETLLVEGTDYTIAFTELDFPSAGSITLLNSDLYTNVNFQVTMTRDTEQVQEYDMEFAQNMSPAQLEFEIDRDVMMVQDLDQKQKESIRFPSSEEVADGGNVLPTIAMRTDTVLGFDSDGNFTTFSSEESSVIEAEEARDKAWEWSSQAEDVLVVDGINPDGYSSFHWSKKSEGFATASSNSADASAEWWCYRGRRQPVQSWGGISPTEAYRDLHPVTRQRAAEEVVSYALERDRQSVRYARAQATRANIENLAGLARIGVGVHNAVKRGRYRRW